MTAITLLLPDEQLSQLRLKAEERGLRSPEALLQMLVDSALAPEPPTGGPVAISPEQAALEAELVRRVQSDDIVLMDEADFQSIREEVLASLAARRQK
ncbi:MAG: hypothetical protein JWO31_624 [Phycisphaerales bacterium]|nr:hypothetical protein [Phycisphaerales bacterium]